MCGGITRYNGRGKKTVSEICSLCASYEGRKWGRESIIRAIQQWATKYGRPPRASDWIGSAADHPSASSVYADGRHFSCWADAIEAAGFERPLCGIYGDRRKWDSDSIVSAIGEWAEAHGRPPVMRDWTGTRSDRPSSATVVGCFGSWASGIEAAGFPRPTRSNRRLRAA